MGLLDDAIREHLELKRRRGADAGEVSRLESEALGPVRRSPDGTPDLASIPAPPADGPPPPVATTAPAHDLPASDDEPDWGDETVALTPPIPAQPPQPPPSHPEPPASGYVMPPALPDPAFDDDEPLPPLDEPDPHPEPAREKRRLPGAGRLRLRRGRADPEPEPAPERHDDPPTAALEPPYEPPPAPYPAPPPPAAYEPPPAAAEPAGDDILEETPEFLEETPDHDRLWFEQRPPRDFDFDK
jgi:hypothetical protein